MFKYTTHVNINTVLQLIMFTNGELHGNSIDNIYGYILSMVTARVTLTVTYKLSSRYGACTNFINPSWYGSHHYISES